MIWLWYSKSDKRCWWKSSCANITNDRSGSNNSFSNFKYTRLHCDFHQLRNTILRNINTIKECIKSGKWFDFLRNKLYVSRSHEWNKISTYNSVANRFTIKLFSNNCSYTASRNSSKLSCWSDSFFSDRIRYLSCIDSLSCSTTISLNINCIRAILNHSCSSWFNYINTSPVSFPRIPYHRTKSSLWINSSSIDSIIKCFYIVAFCFNNFCFKSCSIYPIIRCRCKFKSSIPETN